jgi:trimeric autotransporter adhesin
MASRPAATVSALAVLAPLLALLGPGQPAHAATFTVNSTADEPDAFPGDGRCFSTPSGACTLRAAIMEANALTGADTINLPASTYTLTRARITEDFETNGDLDITADLTIAGEGAGGTTVDGNAAAMNDRVFDIRNGVNVTISGVTIRNGTLPSGSGVDTVGGGGVRNSGTLRLLNVTVSENRLMGSRGGGMYNDGNLTITGSVFSGNTQASAAESSAKAR